MQPGTGSRQFQRALNEHDLGDLGDPERWGGVANIAIDVPIQSEVYSTQIIRVQCEDLVARSWDLLVDWKLNGFQLGDTFTRCGFELTIGIGQASRIIVLDLIASLAGQLVTGAGPIAPQTTPVTASSAWENQPGFGGYTAATVQLPIRIPAVALAGRAVLGIISGGLPTIAKPAIPGPIPLHHRISGSFFAAVCPRSV
jgi:hypothetical protein